MIKDISKNIALYTALLVVLGFINLDRYYSQFNIDILNYLTNTEIIILFLPILLKVLWIIFVIIFWSALFSKRDLSIFVKIMNSKKGLKTFFGEIFKSKLYRFLYFYLLVWLVVGLFSPNFLVGIPDFFCLLFLTLNILTILLIQSKFWFDKFDKVKFLRKNQRLISHLIFIILISTTISQNSQKQASRTKSFGSKFNTSFNYKEKKISTDDSLFLIGENHNYVFLYNSQDSTSMVYDRNNINNYRLKKRKIPYEIKIFIPFTKRELYSMNY